MLSWGPMVTQPQCCCIAWEALAHLFLSHEGSQRHRGCSMRHEVSSNEYLCELGLADAGRPAEHHGRNGAAAVAQAAARPPHGARHGVHGVALTHHPCLQT